MILIPKTIYSLMNDPSPSLSVQSANDERCFFLECRETETPTSENVKKPFYDILACHTCVYILGMVLYTRTVRMLRESCFLQTNVMIGMVHFIDLFLGSSHDRKIIYGE